MKTLENPLLPGELDVEEESLYRRRPRNIEVRRSRFPYRARRVLGWFLLAVVVLIPAGYGGIYLWGAALTSPQLQVSAASDITMEGNRFVSREDLLSALLLPLDWTPAGSVSIFRLNLDEERRQVESIPWVKSASVTRVFPHRLAIHIVERTPVAFVNVSGKVKLVDGEGIFLEKPEKAEFTFPVVAGLGALTNLRDRQARLALYQEFMNQIEPEAPAVGWLVSEVNLTEADDLQALLVQGRETIQVHFGSSNFLQRFRDFVALLPEVRKTNTQIDSVDLRYRNQVVVNPKKPAASGM